MKLYSQDASGGTTGGDSAPTQTTAAPSSTPSPAATPASSQASTPAANTPAPAANTTKGPLSARIKETARQRDAAAKATAASAQAQAGASSPPAAGGEAHTPSSPAPTNSPEPGVSSTPELAPAAATTPEPGLADIIRDQFGVDFSQKYKTDQELLTGLVHAARMVGARDIDAEYGRAYRAHEAEFRQFIAQRQGQGQPQQQPQQFQQPQQPQVPWQGTPWDVPQFNPQWRDFLTEVQDPVTGDKSIGFKPGTPLAIQQQVDDYRARRAQFEHAWAENPAGMVMNLVVPIAQQIAQEAFQQNLGREKSQATAQMIIEQNSEWMFARDHTGQVIYDGFTGKPVTTQRGQVYLQNVQRFMSMTNDPAQLHQLAMDATQGQLALQVLQSLQQQPQTNGQPPVPAGRLPQPNGSPRTPAGAVHRPNATATGAPVQPAPMQFPAGMPLRERIRQGVRAAQAGLA